MRQVELAGAVSEARVELEGGGETTKGIVRVDAMIRTKPNGHQASPSAVGGRGAGSMRGGGAEEKIEERKEEVGEGNWGVMREGV